ncbi:hypothetical protein BCR37DRAFT_392231 [Protomyces lactucae-debilis]|uniref:Uncharacterized protein n=1 Tax=Protomyces lactucae-debilis TaxID=2754530 RepID=A0A1Y2FII0_PROLT|nr:uncharacterized protein BCR37DRAFT_392231 [Protomyces lactucae-debilis]ORY83772.1 hypothetical protein BCR37DRAFT_392231 [Protomyces lactucae-debilis]
MSTSLSSAAKSVLPEAVQHSVSLSDSNKPQQNNEDAKSSSDVQDKSRSTAFDKGQHDTFNNSTTFDLTSGSDVFLDLENSGNNTSSLPAKDTNTQVKTSTSSAQTYLPKFGREFDPALLQSEVTEYASAGGRGADYTVE